MGGPLDGQVWEGPFQWEVTHVEEREGKLVAKPLEPDDPLVVLGAAGFRIQHERIELVHRYRVELVNGKAVYKYKGVK